MMNVTRSAVATICVLVLFGVGTATSAEAPNADADALQLLKKMTDYLGGLETFSPVSYTHLTLPTTSALCRSRWAAGR